MKIRLPCTGGVFVTSGTDPCRRIVVRIGDDVVECIVAEENNVESSLTFGIEVREHGHHIVGIARLQTGIAFGHE